MEVAELKKGDQIFDIDFRKIKSYTYLCLHPHGEGKYHILIGSDEEPIRISEAKLQEILDQNLRTLADTRLELARRLEESAKRIRAVVSEEERWV